MELGSIIKDILKSRNIKNIDYAKSLGVKDATVLNNKFIRNSFSVQDLIKLAELTNCTLCIIDKSTNEIIKKIE